MSAATDSKRAGYTPPPSGVMQSVVLAELLAGARSIKAASQHSLPGAGAEHQRLYIAGDAALLRLPTVAIVGARKASPEGLRRAARLARELVAENVVVVSGLAEGIDTAAHKAALESGGLTIGVVGTPLDRVFPASNAALQEVIYRHHLLVSPFTSGARIGAWNFPERNKVMAAIADVSVIIEASNTSGSLHQAARCVELGRPLFIAKSVLDVPALTWPQRFRGADTTRILEKTADILGVLNSTTTSASSSTQETTT